LAYYAVNGQFLTGYSTYPPAAAPESLCSGSPTVACPCSSTASGTLPGTVRSAPPNVMGIDTDSVISSSSAQQLVAAGYRFAIRYLSLTAPEQTGDLTHAEAVTILNAGLALMPVQHVENPGWTPSASLGTQFGDTAAANASAVGFPSNVNVWMDLEGVASGTPTQAIIDYCNNWAAAVVAEGFIPGLYVGYDTFLTSAQLAALNYQHYWKSLSTVPPISGRGYQLIQSAGSGGYGLSSFDDDMTQTDQLGGTVQWIAE
jgi:hypothetical protein